MHHLPSNPTPSVEQSKPKLREGIGDEQRALQALLNNADFLWFIKTAIRTPRMALDEDVRNENHPLPDTARDRYKSAALLKVETWVEDRIRTNQTEIDNFNKKP